MADGNVVVRLTYHELAEMTNKAKPTNDSVPQRAPKEKEKHQKAKKPEQQIYQVGAKRQIRKPDTSDDRNSQSKQVFQNSSAPLKNEVNDFDEDDTDSINGKDTKRKSRRPDIQLYIPKPRQQFVKSTSVSDEIPYDKHAQHSKKPASFSDDNNLSCGGESDDTLSTVQSPKYNNKHTDNCSPCSPGARTVDMRNQNMDMKVTVTNEDTKSADSGHNPPASPSKKKQQQENPHRVSFQETLQADKASTNRQHREYGEKNKSQNQPNKNNRHSNKEKAETREEASSSVRSSNTQDFTKHKTKNTKQHNGLKEKTADVVNNTLLPAKVTSGNEAASHSNLQTSSEPHQNKSPKKRRRRRKKMNSQNSEDYCEVFEGMVIENSKMREDVSSSGGRKRRDTASSGCGGSEDDDAHRSEKSNNRSSQQRDRKNIHLKVTLAQDERYVKVIDKDSKSKGHTNRTSDSSNHGNRHNKSAQERSHSSSGKRGGLLYLPGRSTRGAVDDTTRSTEIHYEQPSRRGGRSSGRMLYDPNKPQGSRSSDESSAQRLQFYDETDHMPALPYHDDYVKSAIDHDNEQPNVDSYYHHYPVAHYEAEYYMDDPYYYGETQQASSGGSSAEKVLQEATPIHGQLNRLLSRRFHGDSMWQKISALREQVQSLYEQVILLDPDVARKQNTEQLLWKVCYYQVIEMLRRQESAEVPQATLNTYMQQLLSQGTEFYEKLLEKLQVTFVFTLEDYLEMQQLPLNMPSRSVKLALLSAHRIMICLGDLARYKEQVSNSTNYGKARSWYMKSQVLAPKNGRPYNQLAILALYTRRKLDAVYYYMRSLAASNPFWTARESLMSLFDEARKKADHNQKKSKQAEESVQPKQNKTKSHDGERVEIWIGPDQTGRKNEQESPENSVDLTSLSAVELNKRFVLSYLVVHGKLFTKTGMESYHDSCSAMFNELQTLLQHSPSPIGNMRLLQLMAMNMFAIENAKSRVVEDDFEGRCCSVLQEEALQMSLVMFCVLLRCCTRSLHQHLSSDNYQILTENLRQLFPSVKVWCDWMSCHTVLWNPPAVFKKPSNWPDIHIWDLFAEFCNELKRVDTSLVKLYEKQKEGCLPVILNEDNMMTGFVPLLSMPQSLMFVHSTVDMEVARDCLRIQQIRMFGDYLCGIEPPVLKYDVERKEYVSIADTQYYSDESSSEDEDSESDEDVVIESEENAASDEEQHIHQLRRKRQELHQRMEHHQMQQDKVQAVFENENRAVKMELEIRPLYLIPDTNCFIDHLDGIAQILDTCLFTIVVPLIVITELDGLAKGTKDSPQHSRTHTQMVSDHAHAAVAFLEQQFAARNNYLRAITSRGTVMDTILFRSEDIQEEGNNDDTILSCCKHYCKDNPRDYMPKQKAGPIHLLREVVLLTDDRNLRLKAHTCNVPVKDIPAFLTFAKIPKEHV